MTTTTIHSMVTQNLFFGPFSYGMIGFDMASTLTQSTLQTIGLGSWSSKNPPKGSLRDTTALFNVFPFSGGHIPPPFPSLRGASQQPSGPTTSSNLSSGGSQIPQPSTNLFGSMSFSLFGAFRNNAFSSSTFSLEGNPSLNQTKLAQGSMPL